MIELRNGDCAALKSEGSHQMKTICIKVTGTASITAVADTVIFKFKMDAEHESYEGTLRQLHLKTAAIREAVVKSGLARTELKTLDYGIRAVTRKDPKDRVIFAGFHAEHHMHLIHPLDKELLNRLIAAIATISADSSFELDFTVADAKALQR
jgi:uncharacterized protein YggE